MVVTFTYKFHTLVITIILGQVGFFMENIALLCHSFLNFNILIFQDSNCGKYIPTVLKFFTSSLCLLIHFLNS